MSTAEAAEQPAAKRRWFQRGHDGDEAGAVAPAERAVADRLVDMRGLEVREVMTPRIDVVSLTIPVDGDAVAAAVRGSGHSCFPVVSGDLDDVVGILYVNELFRAQKRDQPLAPIDISRRVRVPLVVPESLLVLEAVEQMRRAKKTFAIVTDEYGGVAGVVTVKDLLEPLVGELEDETDSREEPEFVPIDEERWLVDGQASFDEVRDFFEAEIEDGDYVTIGGFVMDRAGIVPEVGTTVVEGGLELKVADMDRRRVAHLVVQRVTEDEPSEEPGLVG